MISDTHEKDDRLAVILGGGCDELDDILKSH